MRVLEMEQRSASLEELSTVINSQASLKALQGGDPEAGIIACGQVIGVIDDLKSVQEVIDEIVEGAQSIYRRFQEIGIG